MPVRVRTALWRSAAIALLLCAVVCLVRWGDASSPARAGGPVTDRVAASSDTSTVRSGPATEPRSPRAPARPVALSLPAIGVTTDLVGLGLNGDGTVEVPADPALAGWYRLGTRPGARGSAVILGHVDSVHGPAVFARLRTLGRGDVVSVRLADGSAEEFRVRSVRTYLNDRFPARRVYASSRGRTLNLVTCGGEYDAARGGYQSNVVVHASWTRTEVG
jgi:hypothetical protein